MSLLKILLKSWEIFSPLQTREESSQKELKNLRFTFVEEISNVNIRLQLENSTDKCRELIVQLEMAKNTLMSKDEGKQRAYYCYENQRQNLQLELTKVYEENESLRQKGLQFADLQKQLQKLETENEVLEDEVSLLKATKSNPCHERNEIILLRQKNHMFVKDKEYLEKKNMKTEIQNKNLFEKVFLLIVLAYFKG